MQVFARLAAMLLVVCACFPVAGRAGEYCSSGSIAPGQLTVVSARVTGSPNEHLDLLVEHPDSAGQGHSSRPPVSYVVTGDRLDLITTCKNYSYVRFHGKERVSTGWVDAARIELIGHSFIPLPSGATNMCEEAAVILNSHFGGGHLQTYESSPVAWTDNERLAQGAVGLSPYAQTHIEVEGRPLVAVTYLIGVSGATSEVQVWTEDLSRRLTPEDMDQRNPLNSESNLALLGTGQLVVKVLGRPMIWTYSSGSEGYLSLIDRTGDFVPVCRIDHAPISAPIVKTGDAPVCSNIAQGKAKEIPLQVAAPAVPYSADEPDRRITHPPYEHSYAYAVLATGYADLSNSGHERPIGIVGYQYESGAGAGSFDHRSVPIFLNDKGEADLGDPINRKLFDAFPSDIEKASLIRFEGATYIALSPTTDGPLRELWKLSGQAVNKVCEYQVAKFNVRVIGSDTIAN